MITKIKSSEYLRRYHNMTAAERQEYASRVADWLKLNEARLTSLTESDFNARLKDILIISANWNDEDCKSFEDGVTLLSGMKGVVDDTWLPDDLYMISARRVVRRMLSVLKSVLTIDAGTGGTKDTKRESKSNKAGISSEKVIEKDTATVPGSQTGSTGSRLSEPIPMRPRHIDQYIHLLPEKTQKRAASVRELLRDLDAARESARKLMDAGEQGDKVAQWAKTATTLDDKVRGIYKELDDEWEKLVQTGKVVVDAVGNVSLKEDDGKDNSNKPATTKAVDDKKAQKAKLRKWLCETRNGNGKRYESHVKKWKDNFSAYAAMTGEAVYKDERILMAAKHYGIDVFKIKINS